MEGVMNKEEKQKILNNLFQWWEFQPQKVVENVTNNPYDMMLEVLNAMPEDSLTPDGACANCGSPIFDLLDDNQIAKRMLEEFAKEKHAKLGFGKGVNPLSSAPALSEIIDWLDNK